MKLDDIYLSSIAREADQTQRPGVGMEEAA